LSDQTSSPLLRIMNYVPGIRQREATGQIIARTAVESHLVADLACDDAEAMVVSRLFRTFGLLRGARQWLTQ
jgi:hypothetical protein